MDLKITDSVEIDENCKLYIPNLKASFNCPQCGHVHKWDNYHYFRDPIFNKKFDMDLCCVKCDYEWICEIYLKLDISMVDITVDERDKKISEIINFRRFKLLERFCICAPPMALVENEEHFELLQDWVGNHLLEQFSYSTAIEIIESAWAISTSDIENGTPKLS